MIWSRIRAEDSLSARGYLAPLIRRSRNDVLYAFLKLQLKAVVLRLALREIFLVIALFPVRESA